MTVCMITLVNADEGALTVLAEDMQNESSKAPVTRDHESQSEDQAAAPTYRPYAVEFAAGAE